MWAGACSFPKGSDNTQCPITKIMQRTPLPAFAGVQVTKIGDRVILQHNRPNGKSGLILKAAQGGQSGGCWSGKAVPGFQPSQSLSSMVEPSKAADNYECPFGTEGYQFLLLGHWSGSRPSRPTPGADVLGVAFGNRRVNSFTSGQWSRGLPLANTRIMSCCQSD